ncbi:MAG TPA: D-2-hydroxyacid dehydrogenase [Xanthobacteraceae bacterium]
MSVQRRKPLVLLWLDEAPLYRKAAAEAGLDEHLEFCTARANERPDDETLQRAEALLAWRVPEGLIPAMTRLRWIQSLSAGVEDWLARPDLAPSVALTCARGIHSEQMPDTILGAIYYVAKPFEQARRLQERRAWERLMPVPLAGKTLGIIGLGTIGADLAKKAAALGLRVIGIKSRLAPVPSVEAVYTLDGLADVLGQSDFVVLLLPVTPATENVIDARALARMKKSAWLLNFARGQHVVDADLVEAVEKGIIAGAVLDAFRSEPLPAEHPFWSTKNILVLPHIGGRHPQRDKLVAGLFVENARRFATGEALKALVDRTRGY